MLSDINEVAPDWADTHAAAEKTVKDYRENHEGRHVALPWSHPPWQLQVKIAVKDRVRGIVYYAGTGKLRIEMIKRPDDSARDEAEATDRLAGTITRKSGPRHR